MLQGAVYLHNDVMSPLGLVVQGDSSGHLSSVMVDGEWRIRTGNVILHLAIGP